MGLNKSNSRDAVTSSPLVDGQPTVPPTTTDNPMASPLKDQPTISPRKDRASVSPLKDQTKVSRPIDKDIAPPSSPLMDHQPTDQQPMDIVSPPQTDQLIDDPMESPPSPRENPEVEPTETITLSERESTKPQIESAKKEIHDENDLLAEIRRRLSEKRNTDPYQHRYTEEETPYEVTPTDTIRHDGDVLFATAFNDFFITDSKERVQQQFAVAGAGGAIVYNITRKGKMELYQTVKISPGDTMYCLAWSYNTFKDKGVEPFIVCGGERGVIYVENTITGENFYFAATQAGRVNDIRVDPKKMQLIFSAHDDGGIRLWNTRSRHLVALFFGWNGHKERVLSLDVHHKYDYLVSSGMDNAILIWDYGIERLKEPLRRSDLAITGKMRNIIHTQEVHLPVWMSRTVHCLYVDTIRWWNDFILTRSVDSTLKIWKPTDANLQGNLRSVCAKLTIRDDLNAELRDSPRNYVHFIDFPIEPEEELFWSRCALSRDIRNLTLGDENGNLWIYKICRETWKNVKCYKYTALNPYRTAIHEVAYNRTGTRLATVQDGGIVRVFSIRHSTPDVGPLSLESIRANQEKRSETLKMKVKVEKPRPYNNYKMVLKNVEEDETSSEEEDEEEDEKNENDNKEEKKETSQKNIIEGEDEKKDEKKDEVKDEKKDEVKDKVKDGEDEEVDDEEYEEEYFQKPTSLAWENHPVIRSSKITKRLQIVNSEIQTLNKLANKTRDNHQTSSVVVKNGNVIEPLQVKNNNSIHNQKVEDDERTGDELTESLQAFYSILESHRSHEKVQDTADG